MTDHGVSHSTNGTRAPLLVGRARERALLREGLAGALAGQGRLVLIGGEAGIGKTALAEATLHEAAAEGATVAVGRCYDLTDTPPYGPWCELFARLPAGSDLPPLPSAAPPEGAAVGAASRADLFARVRDALLAVATSRPLVVLLDDLHWADPASLDLLRFLARGLAECPLLVLVTYRADELHRRHPLYTLLPLLAREGDALRLDLRPLGDDDVRALVGEQYRLGPGDTGRLVGYLRDHAEGNPFYIGEHLRTLEEEGLLREASPGWTLGDLAQARVPPLLRQVIDGRLARLGDDARQLLALAATIGQAPALLLWTEVGGIGEDALLELVERATEARLLEPTADGDGVRFVHALIREALYEGVLPPRRRAWHRRIGEALAARPGTVADAVAYHFSAAGDGRAAEWLIRAGERAQGAYALLTAAERFEAALTALETRGAGARERAELLYRLARMRRYADPHGAIAYLDDAEGLATGAGDGLLAAYAASFRGYLRCAVGEIRRGLAELEAGVAAVEALDPAGGVVLGALQARVGDPPDEQHYRGALASWLALAGRYTEALVQGERVVAGGVTPAAPGTIRASGTSFYANAYRGLASTHAALGRPADARRAYEHAHEAYRAAGHWYQVGNTFALALYEVALPYQTADLAERHRLAAGAEEAWTRASDALADLPTRLAHLPLLILEGEWAEARQLAHATRAPGSRTQWRPFATSQLAQLARLQGDTGLAWSLVRERLPGGAATEPGDAIFLDALPLQRLAVALALDAGDPDGAHSWLDAHDRWLGWSGAVLGRAEGHLLWAGHARAVGDGALARSHAERALAAAEAPRQPLALLAALRFLGELDGEAGRDADAVTRLEGALALADSCAAPYERALTLLALAAVHLRAGRYAAAEHLLDETRAICAPLGAGPALARIDALAGRLGAARAAGPPVPAAPPHHPAGLSAREVEVLRLVASGLTDAQVAERLYLSRRTIGQHLRSIYNKLGVSSRTAATRFALEHGLA